MVVPVEVLQHPARRHRWSLNNPNPVPYTVCLCQPCLPYTEAPIAQRATAELQASKIPLTRCRDLKIHNVYIPPESMAAIPAEDLRRTLRSLEDRGDQLVCGDFNAHHYSWDTSVQETPRGKVVQDWFEESLMAPLNNGNPTRSSRVEQGLTGFSTPDLSTTASSSLQRFSWETLQELNADHLPILLNWT